MRTTDNLELCTYDAGGYLASSTFLPDSEAYAAFFAAAAEAACVKVVLFDASGGVLRIAHVHDGPCGVREITLPPPVGAGPAVLIAD